MKLTHIRTYQVVTMRMTSATPGAHTDFRTDNKNMPELKMELVDNLYVKIVSSYETVCVPLTNVCYFKPDVVVESVKRPKVV